MQAEDCFELGFIIKTHGINGEVQIQIESDSPEHYRNQESVFVEINKKLVPFFIEHISINRNKGIVKFEDIDSEIDASSLSGKKLFLPLGALPSLNEDQFYYHDIIGYQVEDKNLGLLGTVEEIIENPGHDLISMAYQGKEVFIPVTDEVVLKAHHSQKKLEVNLPSGLLDIYLEEKNED